MRAARLYGACDVRIDEVPMPEAGPGEVLLRVRAATVCPSDWRMFVDGHAGGAVPTGPMIQGHEFAGDVVAVGDGVTSPAVGARIAVEPSWHCGMCDMCLDGLTNICRNVVFPSFPPRDGAFAEYIACPAYATAEIPSGVSYVEAALAEPLGVALHAVRLSHVQPNERVLVLGAGVIGICVVQLLRRAGVERIAVVEPSEERRDWPARLGAAPIAASAGEIKREGFAPHVVFECSGKAPSIVATIGLCRPGGRIFIIGIPRESELTLDVATARRHELTFTFTRRSRETLHEALRLAASGEVDLKSIPYVSYSLDQTGEAIDATGTAGASLRSVIEM